MAYKIVYLNDWHNCEVCGSSYAEGYQIYKDGVLVVDKSPIADCYDSVEYPQGTAAFEVLHLEGIVVETEEPYCDYEGGEDE